MSFRGKSQDREAGHDNRPGEHPPEAQGAGQDQGPHARRKETDTSHFISFICIFSFCMSDVLIYIFISFSFPHQGVFRRGTMTGYVSFCVALVRFLPFLVISFCPNFLIFPKKVENLH